MQNRPVMLMLGYAGLLPFYAFLLGAWQLRDWPAAISVQGFVIYSLAILCFLAGTLWGRVQTCLLYTSPSPRDATLSRMPSSA